MHINQLTSFATSAGTEESNTTERPSVRKIKSFFLVRDPDLCINCHSCVKLLPDFIRRYDGRLIISESNDRHGHVKTDVQDVIDSCQGDAITIEVNER